MLDEQRLASDHLLGDARKALPALLVSSLMPRPFMLYFGQELGERGMDAEGYSGRDGRTTIFDYWSVPSIRRWRSGGRFIPGQMQPAEQALRDCYRRILALRTEQAVFASGGFFDLMYANRHLHRQYAFIRHKGKEFALVVSNFSGQEETVSLNLPEHFFAFTGIKERKQLTLINALDGRKITTTFCSADPVTLTLPAHLGAVLFSRLGD